MHYSEFSKALLTQPGVVRLEYLDDGLMKEIGEIEHSPNNVGFTPVDPVGFTEVCSMPLRLIMFCSKEFKMFTETFMDIVDSRGGVVGHDVLITERQQYDSDRYVWLAENIFIDMSALSDYTIKTVIHSFPLQIEGLNGVETRAYYPSATAADYLNSRFGAQGKIVATIILGADGVHFRQKDLQGLPLTEHPICTSTGSAASRRTSSPHVP